MSPMSMVDRKSNYVDPAHSPEAIRLLAGIAHVIMRDRELAQSRADVADFVFVLDMLGKVEKYGFAIQLTKRQLDQLKTIKERLPRL